MNRTRSSLKYAALLTFCVLCIEGVARLGFVMYYGESYAKFTENPGRESGLELMEPDIPLHLQRQLIHPFFGAMLGSPNWGPNRNGNVGRDADFSIALFGGSVSLEVHSRLRSDIERYLASVYPDATLNFSVFSAGGFKQPQQLMQLNYALVNGHHYDLVVNLDGYNEAVLSVLENHQRGVSPHFPRFWDARLLAYAYRQKQVANDVEVLYRQYAKLTILARNAWVKTSAAIGLPLRLRIDSVDRHIRAENTKVLNYQLPSDIEHQGSKYRFENQTALFANISKFWFDSSMMMRDITYAKGIAYIHALQPNQYLDGSKPLSEDEMRTAYNPKARARTVINHVYPMMLDKMSNIENDKIAFIDLTQIFKSELTTLYKDDCCHLNSEGNRLLSQEMMQHIKPIIDQKLN